MGRNMLVMYVIGWSRYNIRIRL